MEFLFFLFDKRQRFNYIIRLLNLKNEQLDIVDKQLIKKLKLKSE